MTHCIFNSNINHNRKNLAMEDFPHLQSNNNIPQLVTGKSFASANENIISPNKMIKTSTVVKIEPVDLSYHPFESVFIKRENTNLPTHMYKPNNKEVIIKQEREDAQNILKQENYEEFEVTMEQEKEDNYQEKLPFDIKDEIPFDIKNEFPLDIKDKIPFDIKDEFPLDIKEEVFEEIPTTVNQTSKSSIVKSCPKPLSNTTLKMLPLNYIIENTSSFQTISDSDRLRIVEKAEISASNIIKELHPIPIEEVPADPNNSNLNISSVNKVPNIPHKIDIFLEESSILEEHIIETPLKIIETTMNIRKKGSKFESHHTYIKNSKMTTINEPDLPSKGENLYKRPKRPCFICHKVFTSQTLPKHLKQVHKDHPNIISLKNLGGKKAKNKLAMLRRKGMDKFNNKLLPNNNDITEEFLLCRKSNTRNFENTLRCPKCEGWMSEKGFSNHKKLCNSLSVGSSLEKNNEYKIANIMKQTTTPYDSVTKYNFKKEILNSLQNGDVTDTILLSEDILYCGQRLLSKLTIFGRSFQSRRMSVTTAIRMMSKLLINCQRLSDDSLTLFKLFTIENYKLLTKGCHQLIYKDANRPQEPSNLKAECSNALRAGIDMTLDGMRNFYMEKRMSVERLELESFEIFLERNKIFLLGVIMSTSLHPRVSKKQAMHLPKNDDMIRIKDFCLKICNKLTNSKPKNFTEFTLLSSAALTRLVFINGRSPCEVAALKIENWQFAKQRLYLCDEVYNEATENEKEMLKDFSLIFSFGNELPVIVFGSTVMKSLDILADKELRKKVGILDANEYLFPSENNSDSFIQESSAIAKLLSEGNLMKITATSIKHLVANRMGSLDVDKKVFEVFVRFLGHSLNINRKVHQCPQVNQAATMIGSLLSHIEKLQEDKEANEDGTSDANSTLSIANHSNETEVGEVEASISTNTLFVDSSVEPMLSCTGMEDKVSKKRSRTYNQNEMSPCKQPTLVSSTSSDDDDFPSPLKKKTCNRYKWSAQENEFLKNKFYDFLREKTASYPKPAFVKEVLRSPTLFKGAQLDSVTKRNLLRTKLNNTRHKNLAKVSRVRRKFNVYN